jgi:hypothetical protein
LSEVRPEIVPQVVVLEAVSETLTATGKVAILISTNSNSRMVTA